MIEIERETVFLVAAQTKDLVADLGRGVDLLFNPREDFTATPMKYGHAFRLGEGADNRNSVADLSEDVGHGVARNTVVHVVLELGDDEGARSADPGRQHDLEELVIAGLVAEEERVLEDGPADELDLELAAELVLADAAGLGRDDGEVGGEHGEELVDDVLDLGLGGLGEVAEGKADLFNEGDDAGVLVEGAGEGAAEVLVGVLVLVGDGGDEGECAKKESDDESRKEELHFFFFLKELCDLLILLVKSKKEMMTLVEFIVCFLKMTKSGKEW